MWDVVTQLLVNISFIKSHFTLMSDKRFTEYLKNDRLTLPVVVTSISEKGWCNEPVDSVICGINSI